MNKSLLGAMVGAVFKQECRQNSDETETSVTSVARDKIVQEITTMRRGT